MIMNKLNVSFIIFGIIAIIVFFSFFLNQQTLVIKIR